MTSKQMFVLQVSALQLPFVVFALAVCVACGGRSRRDSPADNDGSFPHDSAGGTFVEDEEDYKPSSGGSVRGAASGGRNGADDSGGGGVMAMAGATMGGGSGDPSDPQPDDSACDQGPIFAVEVVEHVFGTGQNHNQGEAFPDVVFGPPEAGDPKAVVSLGNGGMIVVAFGNAVIVDGPGPDFVVFENPFPGFEELATVSVSEDGYTWYEYPCMAGPQDDDFGVCAGVHQVFTRSSNGIDPLDPERAGGDWFDLADLGLDLVRYVRMIDRSDWDGTQGVFDLDAVGVRNAACGYL